jgi:hypothetical protein
MAELTDAKLRQAEARGNKMRQSAPRRLRPEDMQRNKFLDTTRDLR